MAEDLQELAFTEALWDRPAPGMSWIAGPTTRSTTWVPLIDALDRVLPRLEEPSWLDAAIVLGDTLELYAFQRAVRPGGPNLQNFVAPVIETAFVRELGLLAHLDQWLQSDLISESHRASANKLRAAVALRLESGPDPGNWSGRTVSGLPTSPPS